MMLLASTSSPAAIRSSTRSSGDALDGHRRFLVAHRRARARFEVGGEEEVRVLVAEAGRVVELAQLVEPTGDVPDLLLELAVGGRLGRLALDVALARRDLEQVAAGRDPPLPHQQRIRLVVAIDGDHDHRAGMVHDVAVELLAVARR